MFFSLQRYPIWQDLHYLRDADFVKNSTAGFKLSAPIFAVIQFISAALLVFLPLRRLAGRVFIGSVAVLGLFFFGHSRLSGHFPEQSLTARYNPLHWFILDASLNNSLFGGAEHIDVALPASLKQADLQGQTLIEKGTAKNVLIVILEGIPGLYHPEIREAMGVTASNTSMDKLAAASPAPAMLIPDFSAHSHQTIRGLYSILCGDFSKFSWDTPKAFELQSMPERARDCLPAQMREHGWSTHYLQAANLGFMSKDRFMPLVGFEHVHGLEWFTETNPFPFEWGVVDSVFFRGARNYIKNLEKRDQPWVLTLLTVGTHQPYAVTDAIAAKYPSRMAATVALLDDAVASFLKTLRKDGVLKDTLVFIVSDESHGSALATWVSSWGLGIVLAPDGSVLPRLKQGGYGLVDTTVSVLDYFDLPVPLTVVGRSFFRDYDSPREMLSYTAAALRRHTGTGMRYECSDDGRCLGGTAASILGEPATPLQKVPRKQAREMSAIARTLDRNLQSADRERVLSFAAGEQRRLNDLPGNDWSDNLIGAQYLDFPANTVVDVHLRLKMLQAPAEGVQLRLLVKEWEQNQSNIAIPELPLLKKGEEVEQSFSFNNEQARQSFSFFLVGTSANALVQIDQFDVVIRADIR
ncbi:MAG: LTA synthase family protein [bacterium]|nr:LTA synthase family protein [bacterium]